MPTGEHQAIASYLSRVVTEEQTSAQKNKVDVRIGGERYTIAAPESEEYIRRVAALVNEKITAITGRAHVNYGDAAVLAACNIADSQIKAAEKAEQLREQVKTCLDDINRLRLENAELRRELTRQQKAEDKA